MPSHFRTTLALQFLPIDELNESWEPNKREALKMQWRCPHCGIVLAVTEDKLGKGWSFSKCYQCGGFALVRRAEINVIKVDKAPPGEQIILPEASGSISVGVLNGEITHKQLKYVPPKIDPEKPNYASNLNPPPPPPSLIYESKAKKSTSQSRGTHRTISTYLASRRIPIAITVAGLIALFSGSFLYIQGKAILEKTGDYPKIQSQTEIHDQPSAPLSPKETTPIPSDRQLLTSQQSHPISPPPTYAPPKLQPIARIKDLQDPTAASAPPLSVRVTSRKVNAHAGPGLHFKVVGSLEPHSVYKIQDWNQNWFKIIAPGPFRPIEIGWVRNDLVHVINKPDRTSKAQSTSLPN